MKIYEYILYEYDFPVPLYLSFSGPSRRHLGLHHYQACMRSDHGRFSQISTNFNHVSLRSLMSWPLQGMQKAQGNPAGRGSSSPLREADSFGRVDGFHPRELAAQDFDDAFAPSLRPLRNVSLSVGKVYSALSSRNSN